MRFLCPWFFIFVIFVAGLFWYRLKTHISPGLRYSSCEVLKGLRQTFKLQLFRYFFLLRCVALLFFIFALARPISPLDESKIQVEGIDIVLAVDCSSSMLAEDFTIDGRRYNRLEVVKRVIKEFINKRQNDRIGIVAFAARAYTVCPLTLDYQWLEKNFERIEIGSIEDGTAIGSGMSSSLNRIKDTSAKGKVIILLTDGRNNAGKVDPFTAAEVAHTLGVKIYTIGAGTKGLAPFPMKDFFGRKVYRNVQIDIDEHTLRKIAQKTEGAYFRATDTKSLRKIYEKIDALEKVTIEEKGYLEYKQLFPVFLGLGLLFLLLEMVLSQTWLRRLP